LWSLKNHPDLKFQGIKSCGWDFCRKLAKKFRKVAQQKKLFALISITELPDEGHLWL